MANKFAQSAKATIGGSRILTGREKITLDEIIKNYPDGVTVDGFDIIGSDDDVYAVFTFAEDPNKYFNGGSLATKVATAWVGLADGDIDTASKELKASGGVKIKMTKRRTRKGNTITTFDPVE